MGDVVCTEIGDENVQNLGTGGTSQLEHHEHVKYSSNFYIYCEFRLYYKVLVMPYVFML